MLKARFVLGAAIFFGAAALPTVVLAQYGGSGMGSALSNDPMSHQGRVGAAFTMSPSARHPSRLSKSSRT